MKFLFALMTALLASESAAKSINIDGTNSQVDVTNFAECVTSTFNDDTNDYRSAMIYIDLREPTIYVGRSTSSPQQDGKYLKHNCIADKPDTCYLSEPSLRDTDLAAVRTLVKIKNGKKLSDDFYAYQMTTSFAMISFNSSALKLNTSQVDTTAVLICDVRIRYLR